MKSKLLIIAVCIIGVVLMWSCKPQKHIAANYNFKTECLGVEGDGSQTLKSWGNSSK